MTTAWYVTLAHLAERPGAVELSQTTQQAGKPPARPELLDALLRGEDTSPWPPAEVEVALAAVERIGEAVEKAQSLIDGFLRQRGHRLPLAVIPPLLAGWALDITRYRLHAHRITDEKTDPIVRDYRDALRLLKDVSKGDYSLGIEDPLPAAGGGPHITGPGRTFSMDSLRDFGK